MNTLNNRAVCYQAIVTRFYGPTNYKPARLKVVASAGHQWHSWDALDGSASDNDRHIAAAKMFADSKGWTGDWYMGGLENGDRVFVNCPSNISGVAFTTAEPADAT